MTSKYSGFWIRENSGNNSFSFVERKERGKNPPQIWVAPLRSGEIADVKSGTQIAFEEIDEHGVLQSKTGLEFFLKFEYSTPKRKIPGVILDNHNHAFYFWHEALQKGILAPPSKLVHIDAHTDLREPDSLLSISENADLEKVFHYTNEVLNVGNFIVPAIHTNCIDSQILMITSELAMENFAADEVKIPAEQTIIVDIDLDFWNTALVDIPEQKLFEFTRKWLARADFITVATSPFFISQERALEVFQKLFE